jgi:hypothetical protein
MDGAHVRVALARRRADRCDLVDAAQVVVIEAYVERSEVLLEIAQPLGAGDRDDVVTPGQQPGERQLPRRRALLRGDLVDLVDEIEVSLEVLSLEPWVLAAEVTGLEVVDRANLAGEEPASQW